MTDGNHAVHTPRRPWRPLAADAPEPDLRGPLRYLGWLVRRQTRRACWGALLSSAWMISLMLEPYVVARGIDDGLLRRDVTALVGWSAALLAVGVLGAWLGILRHRCMTYLRSYGSFHTVELLTDRTLRLGSAFSRRSSTGELATVTGSDLVRISQSLTLVGPGVGALVAYAVVTVVLLSISPLLAAVVLLGVPFLVLCVGPLLRRLQRVEGEYREQQGALTGRAVDIVAGLRVMSGIGGRQLFTGEYRAASQRLRGEGYRVATITSWVEAVSVGLPSLFLAGVVWLGARMAAAGEITVGELTAVYGYVAVLIVPVWFLVSSADDLARAMVSARRVIRILAAEPQPDPVGGAGQERGAQGELRDPASGVTVPPGVLLGLVPRRPADGTAVLDRLARYGDADGPGATWGGLPLAALPLAEVRTRILLAENEAHLFAGTLRQTVSPGDRVADEPALRAAVRVAAAEDVVAGLPEGLDTPIEEQGRNLSGGQRQRLRLARALLAEPEVLLLAEPTSAVDAHTEALVAERLRAARTGRTTVVATASPLLLARADAVALLDEDGRLAATGTHTELLAARPDYRALVHRGEPTAPEGTDR